jgi:hypothetical protein
MSKKHNKTYETQKVKNKYETKSDEDTTEEKIKDVTQDILQECILLLENKKSHIQDLMAMTKNYVYLTKSCQDNKLI